MSCILTRCTYGKNLEMIQPLVQEKSHFVFSALAPWWPNQESDWIEIWSVNYSYLVVHVYKVSGQ
jgi:hypothetical protein